MDTKNIFLAALQPQEPWFVTDIEFKPNSNNPDKMELHIKIDFRKGAEVVMIDENGDEIKGENGEVIMYKTHDTVQRTWQHLNFFQYVTYLHARVPKVSDDIGHCPTVSVPWARKNLGFTLMLEAMILELWNGTFSVIYIKKKSHKQAGFQAACLWLFYQEFLICDW